MFKNITTTNAMVEAGRLTDRAKQRTESQRKLLLDLDFTKKVLQDDERTSSNSSRSSSRAKETSELVQKTLEETKHLKVTFEKGGDRDSESNFETEEDSNRSKQINVDDI